MHRVPAGTQLSSQMKGDPVGSEELEQLESDFELLLIRHLLLEAMHLFLLAFLLLVAMPGAPSSFLLLLVRHLLLESGPFLLWCMG